MRLYGRMTAGLLGMALVAAACSSDDDTDAAEADEAERPEETAAETAFPAAEWAEDDAAELGFDPAKLEEIAAEAEANKSFCLLVVRHGEIAAEWTWGEQAPVEVFSATKSYASTLVGIAEAEGKLDIDDKVSDYVPEWKGTPSESVTIKNLISNDSGRFWSFESDYQKMVGAADRTAYSIGLDQAADPGTVWVYNNSAIQVLEAVLEEATGQQVTEYAEEKIFEPLGMADTKMTTDESGNANVFFGLQSTCRDMARFGHLFLNEGSWEGDELVPAAWVDEAIGAPSTPLNASYGYLWWLNREGPQPNPVAATDPNAPPAEDGQSVPGAPDDMYWAHGLGDQIIQVDPGSDTVVVRLGPASTDYETFGRKATSRIVTEALTDPEMTNSRG